MNQMLAKLSASEKLVGLGGIGVAVGWILGLILGSSESCATYLGQKICSGVSVNYFSWGNAGLMAILAVVAAVAALVVLYLKNSSTTITWPMPVTQILLGLCVAALALGALMLLFQLTDIASGDPALMYVADLVLVGGAAVAAWGAYQGWVAAKK
jgi:hypothetical protein